MFKRISLAALLLSVTVANASAQNHQNRRRGAIMGGLAGAALGVAIGDKGGNETAGALIGGAVGAVAGGAIGDAKDQRIDHNMRYHLGYPTQVPAYGQPNYGHHDHYGSPQPYPSYRQGYNEQRVYELPPPPPYYAPPVSAAPRLSPPLSNQDVVAMVRSGLSEQLIIRQIQMSGVTRRLAVSEVIALHQQGVSEPIIDALQGIVSISGPAEHPYPTAQQFPTVDQDRAYRYADEMPELYGPNIVAPTN